jgi:hypothetical protein
MGKQKSMHERIWSRIDKKGPYDCWVWISGIGKNGYGYIKTRIGPRKEGKNKYESAHRLVYTEVNGPIPEGMLICHKCNNRKCCNPSHLYAGTNQDNMNDKVRSGHSTFGSKNPKARLKESDIVQIRQLRSEGKTLKSIAEQFNVHLATIGYICQGKRWTCVP